MHFRKNVSSVVAVLLWSVARRGVLSFGVLPQPTTLQRLARLDPSRSALFSSMEAFMDGEPRRRMSEFDNLEPLPETDLRRQRMELDEQIRSQFAEYGDDLWDLRSQVDKLSVELVEAINNGVRRRETKIRDHLREAEQRDPEVVYQLELEAMEQAEIEGRDEAAAEHKANALAARKCLPQFNLEGLWVGK